MNEDQYPVVRKSSNGCFWTILVAIALVIATGVIVFLCHEPIAKIVTSEDESVCIDTVKAVEPVLTIQEVLKFREDVREGMRIDSIFLAMPEAILIDILMTHGRIVTLFIYMNQTKSILKMYLKAQSFSVI